MPAQIMIAASALILFLLGLIHLKYTFLSTKFSPRDAELEVRLRSVSPIISHETSMWKAWVGFNASHSIGAMLFGAVYAYLAIFCFSFLIHSAYLLGVGFISLAGYVVLAKRYWFRVPLYGIGIATLIYSLGIVFIFVK